MCLDRDDVISRCIIFAKAFKGAVHVDSFLFVFGETKPDGASHESAVLRRLAIEDAQVHRIGCGIAAIQNARSNDPPRGHKKRRYYCGFRTAAISDLQLTGHKYEVRLTLDEEGGEKSHVDVALIVKSDDKNERNTIKTEAGLALADAFGGATEHVCECDLDDEHHPLARDPECLRRGLAQFSSYYPADQNGPNIGVA